MSGHLTVDEKLQRVPDCSPGLESLTPVPDAIEVAEGSLPDFTEKYLSQLYDSFYVLSARFRIMHR